MARYVFYSANRLGPEDLAAASQAAVARGAKIVAEMAGWIMLDAHPLAARAIASALSGWSYTPDYPDSDFAPPGDEDQPMH